MAKSKNTFQLQRCQRDVTSNTDSRPNSQALKHGDAMYIQTVGYSAAVNRSPAGRSIKFALLRATCATRVCVARRRAATVCACHFLRRGGDCRRRAGEAGSDAPSNFRLPPLATLVRSRGQRSRSHTDLRRPPASHPASLETRKGRCERRRTPQQGCHEHTNPELHVPNSRHPDRSPMETSQQTSWKSVFMTRSMP